MPDLKSSIARRIDAASSVAVWTPSDFVDLASRAAIDKTLQRMVKAGELRRIDRGLYDKPKTSRLTNRPMTPDYRQVIDALARRDQVRMLVDGLTAANDLGLTNAVPARVVIHTDARRRSIRLGTLTIEFKLTAPSKLYWAGRPSMRIVQALHWLKDTLGTDRDRILKRLSTILADPVHGPELRDDLRSGLKTLPAWMQRVIRDLLTGTDVHEQDAGRGPRRTGRERPTDHESRPAKRRSGRNVRSGSNRWERDSNRKS